jgi:hypothetical protein
VVGVLDVLVVQLPVIGQRLREAPDHLHRSIEHAFDTLADLVAQVFLQRIHIVAEAAKDKAAEDGNAQLARMVVFLAETLWHAATAIDAAFEGHALEITLEAVGPGVVHTLEVLDPLTRSLQADQCPAMSAAVFECVDFAVSVARHDNRRLADKGGSVVTTLGDFAVKAKIAPGIATVDVALLIAIDLFVAVYGKGHPCLSLRNPLDGRGLHIESFENVNT